MIGVKWKAKVKTYLATMLPRAVEIAAISRSHDCEWPVGRSSAGDEIRLRARQKRVAGAKRQATGDKKIGVLEGLEVWRKREEGKEDENLSACANE